jgi:hypothetical protein
MYCNHMSTQDNDLRVDVLLLFDITQILYVEQLSARACHDIGRHD